MTESKNDHNPLRWGIVGLGSIAHQFVKDLQLLSGHEAVAAASRNSQKAQEFCSAYGINNPYGDYSEIMEDPDVDIIYIATPHDSHASLSIQAMESGKHVLCEKPLAVNTTQVKSMHAAARENGVFLMEALWSRFNPSIRKVLDLIRQEAIGQVNYLNADFSIYRNGPDESRLLNMDLAGGSLLDIGVYPIFLAYSIFGKPDQILAAGRFHKTGADIQTMAILKYSKGMAQVMSGFISQSDMVARIYGTGGQIFIHSVWHEAQGFTINRSGKSETISLPTHGKGFTYEIEECRRCIAENRLESARWTHQNSLDLITITDEIRRQVGLQYPFE